MISRKIGELIKEVETWEEAGRYVDNWITWHPINQRYCIFKRNELEKVDPLEGVNGKIKLIKLIREIGSELTSPLSLKMAKDMAEFYIEKMKEEREREIEKLEELRKFRDGIGFELLNVETKIAIMDRIAQLEEELKV